MITGCCRNSITNLHPTMIDQMKITFLLDHGSSCFLDECIHTLFLFESFTCRQNYCPTLLLCDWALDDVYHSTSIADDDPATNQFGHGLDVVSIIEVVNELQELLAHDFLGIFIMCFTHLLLDRSGCRTHLFAYLIFEHAISSRYIEMMLKLLTNLQVVQVMPSLLKDFVHHSVMNSEALLQLFKLINRGYIPGHNGIGQCTLVDLDAFVLKLLHRPFVVGSMGLGLVCLYHRLCPFLNLSVAILLIIMGLIEGLQPVHQLARHRLQWLLLQLPVEVMNISLSLKRIILRWLCITSMNEANTWWGSAPNSMLLDGVLGVVLNTAVRTHELVDELGILLHQILRLDWCLVKCCPEVWWPITDFHVVSPSS